MPINTPRLKKRTELGLTIEPFTLDNGCQIATLYLRLNNSAKNSKCTECPFPQCIKELPVSDQRVITKQHKIIKIVYDNFDNGVLPIDISKKCKISYNFVRNCLSNRQRIQNLLDKWGNIINGVKS